MQSIKRVMPYMAMKPFMFIVCYASPGRLQEAEQGHGDFRHVESSLCRTCG